MKKIDFNKRKESEDDINIILLKILYESKIARMIVLQGGNCLRYIYGNPRFSFDLDFVANEKKEVSLNDIAKYIENKIPKYFNHKNFSVSVHDIKKIYVRFYPEDKNKKKIETVIEIINGIPSYTAENRVVKNDKYTVFAISESKTEILADKIVAFGGIKVWQTTPFKAREIWDLYWLFQKETNPNIQMVLKKIKDYNMNFQQFVSTYKERLEKMEDTLSFREEMLKFADPSIIQLILDNKFVEGLLKAVKERMSDTLKQIENSKEDNLP